MAPNHHHSPEDPFSQALAEVLAEDRDLRPDAKKRAFTAQVLRTIEQNANNTVVPAKPVRFWKSKQRLAGLAAVLVLSFLGVIAMISGRFNHQQHAYRMRVKAEKISIPHQAGSLQFPELFGKEDGKNLVFLIYDYYGERCLWLYPERYVKPPKDAAKHAAWERQEKWIQQVAQGSVYLPEAALTRSFPPGESLVLMKIGNHFEIWTRAGLERYFARAGQET